MGRRESIYSFQPAIRRIIERYADKTSGTFEQEFPSHNDAMKARFMIYDFMNTLRAMNKRLKSLPESDQRLIPQLLDASYQFKTNWMLVIRDAENPNLMPHQLTREERAARPAKLIFQSRAAPHTAWGRGLESLAGLTNPQHQLTPDEEPIMRVIKRFTAAPEGISLPIEYYTRGVLEEPNYIAWAKDLISGKLKPSTNTEAEIRQQLIAELNRGGASEEGQN